MRVYQLENELISINLGNFETINDFFHQVQAFGALVEAMWWREEGLSVDSLNPFKTKRRLLGVYLYLSFGKTIHYELEYSILECIHRVLNQKHDNIFQMGTMRSSKDKALFVEGSKVANAKGNPKQKEKTKFYHPKQKENSM